MRTAADSVLILFPGALGDFVCFLPALTALRRRHAGSMRIVAQPGLLELVRLDDIVITSIDRREIADLFADGTPLRHETRQLLGGFGAVYSWTGFGDPRFAQRLADATGGRVGVFPFRGMRPDESAVDYYARCVGLAPRLDLANALHEDAEGLAAAVPQIDRCERASALLMHPGSGAPKKNWQGFAETARRWLQRGGAPLFVLYGPAEGALAAPADSRIIPVHGLSLPQVAALLRRSPLYVGNDSGISHLAGAVVARGVVLFGPSDPTIWAPRTGSLPVIHAPKPCVSCGPDVFCTHRLSVDDVLDALDRSRSRAAAEQINRAAAGRPHVADAETPSR